MRKRRKKSKHKVMITKMREKIYLWKVRSENEEGHKENCQKERKP